MREDWHQTARLVLLLVLLHSSQIDTQTPRVCLRWLICAKIILERSFGEVVIALVLSISTRLTTNFFTLPILQKSVSWQSAMVILLQEMHAQKLLGLMACLVLCWTKILPAKTQSWTKLKQDSQTVLKRNLSLRTSMVKRLTTGSSDPHQSLLINGDSDQSERTLQSQNAFLTIRLKSFLPAGLTTLTTRRLMVLTNTCGLILVLLNARRLMIAFLRD